MNGLRNPVLVHAATLSALLALASSPLADDGARLRRPSKIVERFAGWRASASPQRVDVSVAPARDLPAFYAHFDDGVEIYEEGDYIVLESAGTPDHQSPYWGIGHPLYESPHEGMVVNPNRIEEQDMQMYVPTDPEFADRPGETDLGAIGMAVNGVALYNQYAGRTPQGWLPLDREIDSFDRYHGHPQQQGQYHYHIEPVWLTAEDPSALVGVLLDGIPIYGPEELDGSVPGDLDECNGHVGPTPDTRSEVYHYHVTDVEPYLVGCYSGEEGYLSR